MSCVEIWGSCRPICSYFALVVYLSSLIAHGQKAPSWLQTGLLWFHRVVGSAAILSVLLLGIRYTLIVSGD